MKRLRCAVATLPAEGGDPERLRRSLEAAQTHGRGDLTEIAFLPQEGDDERGVLAAAVHQAQGEGLDWLLAITATETVLPDLFVKTAPALRLHDAVWGAAVIATAEGLPSKPESITRLAAQDLPSFFHAALRWWIGPSHFVRPQAALAALHRSATPGWHADYMMSLWRTGRCYKTAQPLTAFHGALPGLDADDRARLVEALELQPVFMPVHHDTHHARLPYTGLNPVIERDQTRGQFFEAEELRMLADRLPRGQRIVDAGANTGNHTVFFASVLAARTVIPVEPHPRAVAAIRDAVRENGLINVDLSCLGAAIGAARGRLRPVHSEGGGLGATRFVADPDGPIPLVPLDELVGGPVDFLKVDVEGMELEALAGAAGLIARYRPVIFIEVLDARIAEFLAWVDANAYRVEKLFPDKSHCNYLLSPDDQSRR